MNHLHKELVVIGTRDQSTQRVSYSASDVYNNAVWAKVSGYSSSTSIFKAGEPVPPIVSTTPSANTTGSSGGGSFPPILLILILAMANYRRQSKQ